MCEYFECSRSLLINIIPLNFPLFVLLLELAEEEEDIAANSLCIIDSISPISSLALVMLAFAGWGSLKNEYRWNHKNNKNRWSEITIGQYYEQGITSGWWLLLSRSTGFVFSSDSGGGDGTTFHSIDKGRRRISTSLFIMKRIKRNYLPSFQSHDQKRFFLLPSAADDILHR